MITDRVPITPITRADVPFQVINSDGMGPSITAKAVGDLKECSVILDKEAEFGRVLTTTPAFVSVVVSSTKLESDEVVHRTPEQRRDLQRVPNDVADQLVDRSGPCDAAIHRTTTTGAFVPRQMRPSHVKPEVDRQSNEILDRGLVRPSDRPTASPIVGVTKEDGGGCVAGDYRHLNLVYSVFVIICYLLYNMCSELCCTQTGYFVIVQYRCYYVYVLFDWICYSKRYCV